MDKSKIENLVRKTVENQDTANQEKYQRADSVIGNLPKLLRTVSSEQKSSVERSIFSMPSSDIALIDMLRSRAGMAGRVSTSKSEVVRAGLHALCTLDDSELLQALGQLKKVSRGK